MTFRIAALSILTIAALALPCEMDVIAGVHFKRPEIDFGQPPARNKMNANDGDGWRPGTNFLFAGSEVGRRDQHSSKEDPEQKAIGTLSAEFNAERAGQWDKANRLLQHYSTDPNFVASRRELFSTPGLSKSLGFKPFLKATHPLSRRRSALPKVYSTAMAPWIEYARCSTIFEYLAVADRFPSSSRAPAALMMAARMLSQVPQPSLASLQQADHLFRRLLISYPKSRFTWNAEGGLARIDYFQGRVIQAMRRYERQLQTARSLEQRTNALSSILVCVRGNRSAQAFTLLRLYDAHRAGSPFSYEKMLMAEMARFSVTDAKRFWDRLRRDPARLATYVEWRATAEGKKGDLESMAPELLRMTEGTLFRSRVAGALGRLALAGGRHRNARRFAEIALRSGGGDERALGTYLLGTLARREGRFHEAQNSFRHLIAAFPHSYLVEGARESLALVDERLGNLSDAMEQYQRLGYEMDIAYLSDARMSPAELAAYVTRHPQHDDLRYTLAMRYLRIGDWDAAERILHDFSTKLRRSLTGNWERDDDGALQDPLITVNNLRRLDRNLKRANGAEAKASALLAMGDYYYQHKCLLLYSMQAWNGFRNKAISFSWNAKVATKDDDRALARHHDEHECYSQALERYREIVKRFPRTKAAPHAAYWGAVAAEHLSDMSDYWRWREVKDDRMNQAVVLMRFAEHSSNRAVALKARKYHRVFDSERTERRKAFAREKAPPRYYTYGLKM